ncbi:hypothetical protein PG993_011070 [Apiospora rasikravindrae]|uniref:Protein kinase domain-containing protein n=1 Tax=Apiospora rasikravindrae TaxID=990691 RepID=A0ABR1SD64_9PEZI
MAPGQPRTPSPSESDPPGFAESILKSQVVSQFDSNSREFLPYEIGNNLVTEQVVWQELELAQSQPSPPDFRHDLVQWTLTKAKKVFLTLIRCGMDPKRARRAMRWFHYYEFDDLMLGGQLSAETQVLIFPSNPWKSFASHDFLTKFRWENMAPVFTKRDYNYNLHDNAILPFTKKDVNVREGAFSWVYRVTIHPEHTKNGFQEVAIKEIRVNRGGADLKTHDEWEREARALGYINQVSHPHIIPCLAAITRQHSRYFMFPWATGDSLRDFWLKTQQQSPNARLIRQTIAQLLGISEALDRLHNYELPDENDTRTTDRGEDSIRHGDLKPENLLNFSESSELLGTLKIGDMGLAKKHVLQTQARKFMTTTRYGTIQYSPPEASGDINGPLSRLYDIWSMGCIIFEFVIWLLYGNDRLETFYKQLRGTSRTIPYYELPSHGSDGIATVHPVVQRWISHLQKHDPECRPESAIGDLLRLVQHRLLVVDLPPLRGKSYVASAPELPLYKPFQPPKSGEVELGRHRATAEGLYRSLEAIAQKAERDPTYLLTGVERGKIPEPSPVMDTPSYLSPGPGAQKRLAQSILSGDDPGPLLVPSPATGIRTVR